MGIRVLMITLPLVVFPAALAGQSRTAEIAGRVVDPSGASVAGAKVTARNVDTGAARSVTPTRRRARRSRTSPATF